MAKRLSVSQDSLVSQPAFYIISEFTGRGVKFADELLRNLRGYATQRQQHLCKVTLEFKLQV
jgi:hypothetical protein